jgi:hypothetical protein
MKNFKVLSIENADESGTSLKGYIYATYSQLLEVLGKPTYDEPSGDGKVQVEWVVEFEGNIFTIYDWKTGSREYTEDKLTKFNVGGNISASDFIEEVETLINN